MVEHNRRHTVPYGLRPSSLPESDGGGGADALLDGMQKVRAIAALVESAIVWRASHTAWHRGVDRAEPLLSRLLFKEGSQNPQAMDLLARVYFQQQKYEKARDLWRRASELQPGNPALRRTAAQMENASKSPSSALFAYRAGLVLRCALMVILVCLAGWGGVKGYDAMRRWSDGPIAVQNLSGRFHYDYDSITKDMKYVPNIISGEEGSYELGFTRRKASDGRALGRIEVFVERSGSTLKANGSIPNLHVRYLVEQALWDIPGIEQVDLRGLVVDRSYRVAKGDSLWIIARRLFGDGASWTTIARYNDLSDPGRLRVGQELVLPLGNETIELN